MEWSMAGEHIFYVIAENHHGFHRHWIWHSHKDKESFIVVPHTPFLCHRCPCHIKPETPVQAKGLFCSYSGMKINSDHVADMSSKSFRLSMAPSTSINSTVQKKMKSEENVTKYPGMPVLLCFGFICLVGLGFFFFCFFSSLALTWSHAPNARAC